MQGAENTNRQLLVKGWNNIYQSKASKFVLVTNVEGYRYRKEGKHFVISTKSKSQKKSNAVQAEAEKAKTVFMPFDSSSFSFSNASNKEILFHVNLDEEEIITSENAAKITENFFDKEDGEQNEQIEGHAHPVLINTSPYCPNNCLLAMYPDEELPQVIGQDIVLLLLNIFRIFPGIKVGYNSVGAGCSVNNLHFQLFYSEDLIGEPTLPLEREPRSKWIESSLNNPSEEINLYSVGIKIQTVQESSIAYALVISALTAECDESELANSISFVFGLVANELIELCIPHNVIFTKNGTEVFIILRDYGSGGWLEYSGVAKESEEGSLKEEEIVMGKGKVDQKQLDILLQNVQKHLKIYS